MAEDDNLEIPESPPETRLGEQKPPISARGVIRWLEVKRQGVAPSVHLSVDRQRCFGGQAEIPQQTVVYVVCLHV